jgi:hypothetical protein
MLNVWETGEMHRGFCGKVLGKGPPERPRRRWEDNIKIGLQEAEWWLGLD